jgi:non-ribosomal peptide synthase protein (TIGR01720 family)
VLGIDELSIHDNFFELGGDSILSIQIVARANQAGLKLTPRNIFQHQTIAELAAVAGKVETVTFEQGLVIGPVPLTPVQKRFLSQEQPASHYYNQAMLFDLSEPIQVVLLEQALERLVAHHDALRLRFDQTNGDWRQSIAGMDDGALESAKIAKFDLADLPHHAAALQASLNLENGPLMRVALFESNQKNAKLLIVIHHLAVDGVSWRILLEDLQSLYSQLSYGQEPKLPSKTTSFKNWSERLQQYALSKELRDESSYWLKQSDSASMPIDYNTGENNSASAAGVSAVLNPRETLALLMEAPSAYRTQINEVLVTALAHTLAEWIGSPSVLLDLEGHGREEILPDVDLTRTVGWFTTIFPVALDLTASEKLIERLRLVKEQLRTIPNRGIGYGVLRYLSADAEISEALNRQPQAQIRFNYLGQTDRGAGNSVLLKPAAEASGPSQSPASPRGYHLNVIAAVRGGQLRIEWTYSQNIHARETIEKLANRYLETLRTLIVKARSADAASFSPSDFSSTKLSREDLSKVLAKLRG